MLYSYAQKEKEKKRAPRALRNYRKGFLRLMILYEELFFEITMEGTKSELKKMAGFLKSGELDDFFECSSDYISYDDSFATAGDNEKASMIFTNDDLGVEIGEFNPEEFLDVFCKAARALDVHGHFYDIDDEEYSFVSLAGDEDYENGKATKRFNDELDEEAYKEEQEEE